MNEPATIPGHGRLATIWLAQIRYAIVRELNFRGNFLIWIIVDVAWFLIHVAFIHLLYSHVDQVAGWNKEQMLILIGTHQLSQQIFSMLFMSGLMELPRIIRTGHLDFLLTKPVPVLFLISTHKFDLSGIVNAALGTFLVVTSAHTLGIEPSLTDIGLFLLLACSAILVHYGVLLALVSLAFWTTEAESVGMGYYSMLQVARIPRQAVTGIWKILFTWLLPISLAANLPAEALQQLSPTPELMGLAAVPILFCIFSIAFFQRGLARYKSASS